MNSLGAPSFQEDQEDLGSLSNPAETIKYDKNEHNCDANKPTSPSPFSADYSWSGRRGK